MDEKRLIERMKYGDEEAFIRIYEKYRELVYRTACLIMGDAVSGEDVAQDTWVQVYLHIKQLHDSSRFKPWMMQILHRAALKYKQKAPSRPDCLLQGENCRKLWKIWFRKDAVYEERAYGSGNQRCIIQSGTSLSGSG